MNDAQPWTTRRRLHAGVWAAGLMIWTALLLDPNPVPPALQPQPWLAYLLAKSLHVTGYFVCTLLGLGLWRAPTIRVVVAGMMVWHAIGTEVGQCYIPTRSGSPKDVGWDFLGITLSGALVWWRQRRRNSLFRSR